MVYFCALRWKKIGADAFGPLGRLKQHSLVYLWAVGALRVIEIESNIPRCTSGPVGPQGVRVNLTGVILGPLGP